VKLNDNDSVDFNFDRFDLVPQVEYFVPSEKRGNENEDNSTLTYSPQFQSRPWDQNPQKYEEKSPIPSKLWEKKLDTTLKPWHHPQKLEEGIGMGKPWQHTQKLEEGIRMGKPWQHPQKLEEGIGMGKPWQRKPILPWQQFPHEEGIEQLSVISSHDNRLRRSERIASTKKANHNKRKQ